MFHWLFDLLYPNYDPPPPRENVMRMARDVVKFRCRLISLEANIRAVVNILSSESMPEDKRIEAAKRMLANALKQKESELQSIWTEKLQKDLF